MKTLFSTVGALAVLALSTASGGASAETAPRLITSGGYTPVAQLLFGRDVAGDAVLQQTQFLWSGRNYCWYDGGWRGPGFYWCGYAWRRGYGWGGPVGWHGWARGGGGYHGGGHGGGFHGGGGYGGAHVGGGGFHGAGGAHDGGGHMGGGGHGGGGHEGGGHGGGGGGDHHH